MDCHSFIEIFIFLDNLFMFLMINLYKKLSFKNISFSLVFNLIDNIHNNCHIYEYLFYRLLKTIVQRLNLD